MLLIIALALSESKAKHMSKAGKGFMYLSAIFWDIVFLVAGLSALIVFFFEHVLQYL